MSRKLRKILIITLSLVCLILPQAVCLGADYYVDAVNGNDSDPGTSAAPWQTLNRAYTWYGGSGPKVQEGDTVIFRDGDYGEFRESTHDGQARLFYRNNWIIYKADSGHTPILTRIDIYNMDKWGGVGNGNSYLIFDGFEIQGGVVFHYTSYAQVRNCTITPPSPPYEGFYAPYVIGTGVEVRDGHYITIENNEISNVYRGISNKSGTDNVVIRNNVIHYIGEDGIGAPISHVLIEGNHIYDTNKYRTPIAMYGTKSGNFIEGEKVILDIGGEGIVHRWTGSYLLVYVTTEWLSTHHGEGGTITGQTSGATLSNITKVDPSHTDGIQIHTDNIIDIVITNNIIHDIPYQGIKLQSSNGGNKDVTVANNLVYNIGRGMSINGYSPVSVYNNTFEEHVRLYTDVDNMYNNIFLGGILESGGGAINHGNNIFEDSPSFANATELVNTIPEFVDVANGDFHLTPGSVAIDFGAPAYAPATDIEGNPRDAKPDAGCYEYGASPPSNKHPVANAGEDQTLIDNDRNGSEQVTLDGSGSKDPDGTIVSYVWSEGGLQIATGIKPTVILSTGTHLITLTVTDNGGLTDTDTVTIKVLKGDKEFGELPTGCYNNVFNPTKGEKAIIVVEIEEQGYVRIGLYDIRGNKIKELADEEKEPGRHKYYWDGKNDSGNIVGSGLYFVHIHARNYKKTKKIVVVK